MNALKRTRICLIFNILTLIALTIIVSVIGTGKYLRFGPSEELEVIGIKIDTWTRWAIVCVFIVFISVSDTFINEWGMPFVTFRIYDPNAKVIKDVGPFELQVLANGMYLCSSIKNVFYTLCYVSQIDFALIRMLTAELTSIITIRSLIKEKKFKRKINEDEESIASKVSKGINTEIEEKRPLLGIQVEV